jgi:hemolysin D
MMMGKLIPFRFKPDIPPVQSAAEAAHNPTQPVHSSGSIKPVKRLAEELAFLPATLEVIESPPSPTARYTTGILCTLLTIALLWACVAKIDLVAVAPGKVVPLGQIKVIQPFENAVIRHIFVDDGDHVVAGQRLVELDPTDVRADLEQLIYDQRQAGLDAEVARLLLAQDPDAPFIAPEGVDLTLAESNHLQAVNEIRKFLAQIRAALADNVQRHAALEANDSQIERAKTVLPLLTEKFETASGLFDKKFGTRAPMLDTQQQMIERQADLAGAQAAKRQIEAELDSLNAKLTELRSGFLADAADRRTKALQKLTNLTQQIAKARQREAYRHLTAPVGGTVQGIKIHTPGAVVTSADTLMTIVPEDTGLEIEAMVDNKDIGFVRENQDVQIKFDAFPFTRYGLLKGHVRRLGRDAATPQQLFAITGQQSPAPGAMDLAYPAKITLDQTTIMAEEHYEPIQPGMRVSAEIRTGNRRVISYLLSPIIQTVKEAGRER